jgi:hypothetical protein
MCRVDAPRIAAEVVEDETFRYRTNARLIDNAMRDQVPASDEERSVVAVRGGSSPIPASGAIAGVGEAVNPFL